MPAEGVMMMTTKWKYSITCRSSRGEGPRDDRRSAVTETSFRRWPSLTCKDSTWVCEEFSQKIGWVKEYSEGNNFLGGIPERLVQNPKDCSQKPYHLHIILYTLEFATLCPLRLSNWSYMSSSKNDFLYDSDRTWCDVKKGEGSHRDQWMVGVVGVMGMAVT